MLNIQACTDTFSMFNTHCFPSAKMVTRTPLIVTLYGHCLSIHSSAEL